MNRALRRKCGVTINPSPMSYPSAMKPMAARLSGFNSTVRRVDPIGKFDNYKAGQTVKFVLPSNSVVDLRTLKLHFAGTTDSAPPSVGTHPLGIVAFPSPIHGIIDQIIVLWNNIQVEATPNGWGFLQKMIDDFTVGEGARRARQILQNETMFGLDLHDQKFHTVDTLTSATDKTDAVSSIFDGYRDVNREFVIDSFPASFLGTVQCPVMSTSLTGDFSIEIRWAPNSVLTCVGTTGQVGTGPAMTDPAKYPAPELAFGLAANMSGWPRKYNDRATGDPVQVALPTNPSYRIDDVYLTIKTLSIEDGQFYSWLKSEVERAPIDYTHSHWVMNPGTLSSSLYTTTRATINSSCVDMLIGTFVGDDSASGLVYPGQPRVPAEPSAFSIPGQTIMFDGTYCNTHTNRAFQRGNIETSTDDFTSQFTINNVDIQPVQGLADIFADVKEEFNLGQSSKAGMNPRLHNLAEFAGGFFIAPVRLNFKASDETADTVRYLSGLDSRNATVSVLWRTQGTIELKKNIPLNVTPQIWVGSTSIVSLASSQRFSLTA